LSLQPTALVPPLVAVVAPVLHSSTNSPSASATTLYPSMLMCTRGSRFLSYNFLQFAIDGKNNSKTKVEKVFFFIFMFSYAEMSF
jgi:hypothetical protein